MLIPQPNNALLGSINSPTPVVNNLYKLHLIPRGAGEINHLIAEEVAVSRVIKIPGIVLDFATPTENLNTENLEILRELKKQEISKLRTQLPSVQNKEFSKTNIALTKNYQPQLTTKPVFLTTEPQSSRNPNFTKAIYKSRYPVNIITQRTTETQTVDHPQELSNLLESYTKNTVTNTSIKRRTQSHQRDTSLSPAGEFIDIKGINKGPETDDKKGILNCSYEQNNQSISNQYHLRNIKKSSSYDQECLSEFNRLINEVVDYDIVSSPTKLLSPKTELPDIDDLLNIEESTIGFNDFIDTKSELIQISTDPKNILSHIKELEDTTEMDYTSSFDFSQTAQSPDFITDYEGMQCMNPRLVCDNTFGGEYVNPFENSIDLSSVNMESKVPSPFNNTTKQFDLLTPTELTDSFIFANDYVEQPTLLNSTTPQAVQNGVGVDPTNVTTEDFQLLAEYINNDRITYIPESSSLNSVSYEYEDLTNANHNQIIDNTVLENTSSFINFNDSHNISHDNDEITSNNTVHISTLPSSNNNNNNKLQLIFDFSESNPSVVVEDANLLTLNTPDITNEILNLDAQVTYNIVPYNVSINVSINIIHLLFTLKFWTE